ncbi:Ser/Thr protein phosphatase [Histomonas meleagridis]|uniref:Ser/Thr protein phosphatase n=1 Tax=Histomonas meleagridis TaxID=135588 RepID=UPI00355A918C|nr:Ser/Thr protein phosphatase [Histomonas meleagridis]KAH0803749.1 Ser/Thr protein phosphatase [Histomonas meleagridis]
MKCNIFDIILAILTLKYQGGAYVWDKKISEECINKFIKNTRTILSTEPSLLNLTGNFTVVGDIHGQLYSLLRIFDEFGYPPQTNYLFLGDYVDRGKNSLEVILLLLLLKSQYPHNIYLLRGNHEDEYVSTSYGFKAECLTKFTPNVYEKFIKTFKHLPYSAIINNKYLCVHGGIGPHVKKLIDIERIKKPSTIEMSEISLSIVWSDPSKNVKDFKCSYRGKGYLFGQENLRKFLSENNLTKLIRAHEYFKSGYTEPLEGCISLFSAMNYFGDQNNISVAIVNENVSIYTFEHASEKEIKEFKPKLPENKEENENEL